MTKAFSVENKLTFELFTLKGSGEQLRRVRVKYNGCFDKSDETIGYGNNDTEALITGLKHQTYLHQEYKEKYYNLLTKLDAAGFILKEVSGCDECNREF